MAAALHDAAAGRLPEWAVVSDARREHIARVAALIDAWAVALGIDEAERARWRAAAWLHDALRDAAPATLRAVVPEHLRTLPAKLLHGPAAAARLEGEGVDDAPLLLAIGFHTVGHPALDRLGRALYLADYLEPGRDFLVDERAALRARMPGEADAVIVEVVRSRIGNLLDTGCEVRPETIAFWNAVAPQRSTSACAP